LPTHGYNKIKIKQIPYIIRGYGSNNLEIKINQSLYHIELHPTGTGLDKYLVQEVVKKYANKKLKILKLPKRPGDMVKITANNNNLKKFINWKPKFNKLSLMVKSCLLWEKKLTGKF